MKLTSAQQRVFDKMTMAGALLCDNQDGGAIDLVVKGLARVSKTTPGMMVIKPVGEKQ